MNPETTWIRRQYIDEQCDCIEHRIARVEFMLRWFPFGRPALWIRRRLTR